MTKSPVMIDRRALLCTTVLGWLMAGPARAASGDFVAAAGPLAPGATPSDTRAEALHLLNRLAYGPTADEFERVMRIGAERWVDEQLHPERVALAEPLGRQLATLAASDESQRTLLASLREAQAAARDGSESSKARLRELFQRVGYGAAGARLLRAVASPCQLEEVMVDFWFNHFNVFIGKGLCRVLVGSYEREAIRPHVLGHFRDLLGATAHHPAMLFYLDNWLSVAPGWQPPRGARAGAPSGLNENYARELMELHTLGVDGGYTQADVTALARMLTGWTIEPRRSRGDSVFWFDAGRHDDGDKRWLGHTVRGSGQAEGEWALDVLAAHPATARHLALQLAQYFVADRPPPALVARVAQRFLASGGDIRAVLATLFASPEFRAPGARGAKFKTPYQYVLSAVRAGGVPLGNVRPLLGTMAQLGMPLYGCLTPDGYKNTEQAWLNPDAITRRVNFATALAAGRLPLARPAYDDVPIAMPAQAMMASSAMRPAPEPGWFTPPLAADALLDTLGESISERTRAMVAESDPPLRAALVLGSPDFMRR